MADSFRRKAYGRLLEWKEGSHGTTAVLISGARRVGKTHLALEFASKEYRSFIYINFDDADPDILRVFEEYSHDRDLFFQGLMLVTGKRLHPRESVIVFDEVQRYPKARQLIKYLVEDGRYDYIETGSLLSIKTNVSGITLPSEEVEIELRPMDFEEFLWAMGDEMSMPYARERFERLEPLGDAVHSSMSRMHRRYMMVGGMPQAVAEYKETGDFGRTDVVKRNILALYRRDIAKFAPGYHERVTRLFEGIPAQLSTKEKRFNLSSIDKDARMRDYDDAFMWLLDGMVVNPCFNSTDPNVGLGMYRERASQKLYMADTGLLVTMSMADDDTTGDDVYRSLMMGRLGVNEGMFAENFVAQELRASGHRLYFYSRYSNESSADRMEIDFLVRRGGRICPVEVKSSGRLVHSSLDKFQAKFGDRIGQRYILCTRDIQVRDGIVLLPIYLAGLLRRPSLPFLEAPAPDLGHEHAGHGDPAGPEGPLEEPPEVGVGHHAGGEQLLQRLAVAGGHRLLRPGHDPVRDEPHVLGAALLREVHRLRQPAEGYLRREAQVELEHGVVELREAHGVLPQEVELEGLPAVPAGHGAVAVGDQLERRERVELAVVLYAGDPADADEGVGVHRRHRRRYDERPPVGAGGVGEEGRAYGGHRVALDLRGHDYALLRRAQPGYADPAGAHLEVHLDGHSSASRASSIARSLPPESISSLYLYRGPSGLEYITTL